MAIKVSMFLTCNKQYLLLISSRRLVIDMAARVASRAYHGSSRSIVEALQSLVSQYNVAKNSQGRTRVGPFC